MVCFVDETMNETEDDLHVLIVSLAPYLRLRLILEFF